MNASLHNHEDQLYTLLRGDTPLLINAPHAGTFIPEDLRADLSPVAQNVPDTDWHMPLLYEFALARGVTLMAATHARYVVDLNRDPSGVPLYPGVDNTELCPTSSFAYEDLYQAGRRPDAAEIEHRRTRYWAPYHGVLAAELAAIHARHGYALLLDGHSIRAVVPRFFDGRLPDLNLGTADGKTCAPVLQTRAYGVLKRSAFSAVLNGRFKGGYITRHYGRPDQNVHVLQLELAQACYMDEHPPYAWNPLRAQPLIAVLRLLVASMLEWRP